MLFSSKWLYFIALMLSSLSKTSAMRSSVLTAENFTGTTSPISLFLFPVTFANSYQGLRLGSYLISETVQLGRDQQASSNSAASCQWEVYKH